MLFVLIMFILLYFQIDAKVVLHVWAYLGYSSYAKYPVRLPKLSLEYAWAAAEHISAPLYQLSKLNPTPLH